MQYGELE